MSVEEKSKDGPWSWTEFELLPLHEADRKGAVVEGVNEVRYWVNDGTEFAAGDVLKADEGDDDYFPSRK